MVVGLGWTSMNVRQAVGRNWTLDSRHPISTADDGPAE
jgi:hypothetical protein